MGLFLRRIREPHRRFGDPPVSIQIAELDPNNPYPEVVVSFYTGGAHCCSSTSVVTSNADGSEWTVVDVGEFDGGPLLAVDLDDSLIVDMLSDFALGGDTASDAYAQWEKTLRLVSRRHDVVSVSISDPAELDLPSSAAIRAIAA